MARHNASFIEDRRSANPAETAITNNLRELTEDVLSTLTPREKEIIKMRFGLDQSGEERTLEEVGKHFNVTRERIRQIEAKALAKLRHPSRSRRLRAFLMGRRWPIKHSAEDSEVFSGPHRPRQFFGPPVFSAQFRAWSTHFTSRRLRFAIVALSNRVHQDPRTFSQSRCRPVRLVQAPRVTRTGFINSTNTVFDRICLLEGGAVASRPVTRDRIVNKDRVIASVIAAH